MSKSLENGFTGCPCCAGRKLSITNSFAARYPDGVALWHPTRNGDLLPTEVLGGSPVPVWWQCPAGADHEWQAAPLHLGKASLAKGNTGCPFCRGLRASATNNLNNFPHLVAEWHPTANGDLTPADVVAGTGEKLWWRCVENPNHEWRATGANRTRGRNCPMCKKSLRSILEVGMAFELQTLLPGLDLADDKVVVDGVIRHVDLLLRDQGIVIEVDGRFRHDGAVQHERDAAKSQVLTDAGYRVLRLREEPLRPVTPNDAHLPQDPTIKQATDAVLARLRDLGWLNLPVADEYLAETKPRRQEEALDHVRGERPGKSVRAPGPVTFTRHERWQNGFAVLLRFVERESHANVPFEHVEDDFPLGKWVGAKRSQQRRGRMNADREQLLSELPGWTWDAVEDAWETGFQRLQTYRAREGHIRVPTGYRDNDGYPLGQWLRSHRRRHGGRRTITEEQRLRLEALPDWSYEAATDVFWDRAAAAFEAYVTREGHCQTPRHHREDGINIDAWSKQQRAKYHQGNLPAERITRLEAVPDWSWSPQKDAWERGFAVLVAHVGEHGSAAVRRDERRDGYPLGAWAGEQRNRHSLGTLEGARL
ncbi:MAG: Helicase associated domain protein, partial [Mycobacteriaceae bacterium]